MGFCFFNNAAVAAKWLRTVSNRLCVYAPNHVVYRSALDTASSRYSSDSAA